MQLRRKKESGRKRINRPNENYFIGVRVDSTRKILMSKFTKILLALLGAATVIVPVFVKNPKSRDTANKIETGLETGVQILEAESEAKA